MGNGDPVAGFDTAVVGIRFADKHCRFVLGGACDDTTTQKARRDCRIGLVFFPDGDGVTRVVALVGSLADKHVRIASDNE